MNSGDGFLSHCYGVEFAFLHLPVVVAHFSVRVIVVHFVVAAGLVAAEDAEGVADVARGGGDGGGVGSCDTT